MRPCESLSVEVELEALQNRATERLLRQQQHFGSSRHHGSAHFHNGMDTAEGSSTAMEGSHLQSVDGVRKERVKRGRKKRHTLICGIYLIARLLPHCIT